MTGRVPLVGLGFGTATGNITARNIKVPVGDGIELTANADLIASYNPTPRCLRTRICRTSRVRCKSSRLRTRVQSL